PEPAQDGTARPAGPIAACTTENCDWASPSDCSPEGVSCHQSNVAASPANTANGVSDDSSWIFYHLLVNQAAQDHALMRGQLAELDAVLVGAVLTADLEDCRFGRDVADHIVQFDLEGQT